MGKKLRVIYVAHPVSGDVRGNVNRALRWLRWLMERTPGAVFVAPWIEALLAGADDSDPVQRERGLRDNLEIIKRCDALVLVGGRVSTGMRIELNYAWLHGHACIDLTHLGAEPPSSSDLLTVGLHHLDDMGRG